MEKEEEFLMGGGGGSLEVVVEAPRCGRAILFSQLPMYLFSQQPLSSEIGTHKTVRARLWQVKDLKRVQGVPSSLGGEPGGRS